MGSDLVLVGMIVLWLEGFASVLAGAQSRLLVEILGADFKDDSRLKSVKVIERSDFRSPKQFKFGVLSREYL